MHSPAQALRWQAGQVVQYALVPCGVSQDCISVRRLLLGLPLLPLQLPAGVSLGLCLSQRLQAQLLRRGVQPGPQAAPGFRCWLGLGRFCTKRCNGFAPRLLVLAQQTNNTQTNSVQCLSCMLSQAPQAAPGCSWPLWQILNTGALFSKLKLECSQGPRPPSAGVKAAAVPSYNRTQRLEHHRHQTGWGDVQPGPQGAALHGSPAGSARRN